jgi:Flp pilus assembly protein TadG
MRNWRLETRSEDRGSRIEDRGSKRKSLSSILYPLSSILYRRSGAAATELAILLPALVFLFVVAVDFCRVYSCSQTIQGCAQTAALYASGTALPPPNTTATDAAKQAAVADAALLSPALTTDNVTVTTTTSTATVTVSYDFQFLVPYPGLSQTQTLVRTVTMNMAPQVGQGN